MNIPSKLEQIDSAKSSLLRAEQKLKTLDQRKTSKRSDDYKYWLDRQRRLAEFVRLLGELQCKNDHTTYISFGRCEMQSGEYHIMARCSFCHSKIGQWISKDKLPGDILASLPIFESYLDYELPCEVCGEYGVQLHHWAPREFFPDTCEQWPKSYLCPKCHQEWHNIITIPLHKLLKEANRNGSDTTT